MKLTNNEYLTEAEKIKTKLADSKGWVSTVLSDVVDCLKSAEEIINQISGKCKNAFEESSLPHPEEIIGFEDLDNDDTEHFYELWDVLIDMSHEYDSLIKTVDRFETEISNMIKEVNNY